MRYFSGDDVTFFLYLKRVLLIFYYLVVNRKTAFEIDWPWQQTLHILHGHPNFNAVTLSYNGNVFDIFQSLIS